MDDHLLSGFPQFVTGSNIISLDRIQVHEDQHHTRKYYLYRCHPPGRTNAEYQSAREDMLAIVR
ncbi:hypothetical protein pdam_00020134 [Pocillopora damicornis]|uniref:Uncharacterized protein n=1 Tax=Pocillopora damicornis TaxID=46731 RepID=A0A3M6UC24_POCDA|nr:hypothetical protein pdam_00020134 [Pocillopora damicornis]